MADVCGHCHMVLAGAARYCPHCGSTSDGSPRRWTLVDALTCAALIVLILAFGFLGSCSALIVIVLGPQVVMAVPLSLLGFTLCWICIKALRARLRPPQV